MATRVGLVTTAGVQEKSTCDQAAVGREWAARAGAAVADTYSDPDISASRFTKKNRPQFDRMIADVQAGKLDLIWFWELSRSQRRLDVFASLRDLCREKGVLWVIRDRVYDPASYADMMTLGMLSVIGENESEMTSQRVRRGLDANAAAGRPHAHTPYGYRRNYDRHTKAFLSQDPDVLDGNGRAIEDSPAWVVRQVFEQFAAGKPLIRICRDLDARRIPTPGGGSEWRQS